LNTASSPIEREVVVAFDEKLLVVIEQVQAAFEVRKHDRDRLDLQGVVAFGQVFEALFVNGVGRHPLLVLLFDRQL
jgi:hypothetical protein